MMDDVFNDAMERFRDSHTASEFNRRDALEDIRFSRLGDQWPDEVREQRLREGRPALTVNKLNALIHHAVNQARQSKPGIKVGAVDNGADVETAEVISGLIRSIERGSNAEIAYDTAIENAIAGGFGFFRIGIDYAHDDTFDMECRIERIPNPLMVHWDTRSTEFDSSDWEFAFVSDFWSKELLKSRFPDADLSPFEGDGLSDELVDQWTDEEMVRIAEYWLREEKTRNLLMLSDGRVVREDFFDDNARALADLAGISVVREREVRYHEVTRRLLNGYEVLDEEPWPGSVIPICPVWGDEVIVDGRRHFRSMTRDARDPQMMFNFWRSASTELVALAPKAPWVGEKGFVPKGQETMWQSANTRTHAYLEHEPGKVPQRQPVGGVPTGVLQEATNAAEDIQTVTNMYPASIGARSNETSGRAILARERQGDQANFHFIDNLNRAIRGAGKILVDIIPAVYGEREAVRILGEDMKEKVVKLTQEDGGGEVNPETGERDLYNLSVGKYDVEISAGPSFATQREETRETLIEIMRAVPGSAQFIGDVLLEHMDFQGADKVAKRLQMLLPPNVQQAEGVVAPQPDPGVPGMPAGFPPGTFPEGGLQ